MATQYATVEVWVVVDSVGDYEVGTSADAAVEQFDANIGSGLETGRRFVKVNVKVPLPTTIELAGEVTADEDAGELKVA